MQAALCQETPLLLIMLTSWTIGRTLETLCVVISARPRLGALSLSRIKRKMKDLQWNNLKVASSGQLLISKTKKALNCYNRSNWWSRWRFYSRDNKKSKELSIKHRRHRTTKWFLTRANLPRIPSNLCKRNHSKIALLSCVELQDSKPLASSDLIITWARQRRIIRNSSSQSMKKIRVSKFGLTSISAPTLALSPVKIGLKSYISTTWKHRWNIMLRERPLARLCTSRRPVITIMTPK